MLTKKKLEKDVYYMYVSTMLLIHEMYENKKVIMDKACESTINKFYEFCGYKTDEKLISAMYGYSTMTVEYLTKTSTIMNLYSTFEQYIKSTYDIELSGKESLLPTLSVKYKYDLNSNQYYNIVEKYRQLYNALKHGKPNKEFIKNYPNMIDKDNLKLGSLGNAFSITSEDIAECCSSLIEFTKQLNKDLKNKW